MGRLGPLYHLPLTVRVTEETMKIIMNNGGFEYVPQTVCILFDLFQRVF